MIQISRQVGFHVQLDINGSDKLVKFRTVQGNDEIPAMFVLYAQQLIGFVSGFTDSRQDGKHVFRFLADRHQDLFIHIEQNHRFILLRYHQ